MKRLLIKNCRLVPQLTEGFDAAQGDVLIQDGVIQRISANLSDAEAQELDIHGMTLLPGIIDMHVHLGPVNSTIRKAGKSIFDSYKFAKYLMSIGVTTLRDCGNDYFLPAAALRDAIREGIIPGPRILSSGNTISTTSTGNEYYTAFIREYDGPIAMRRAAREAFKEGADFLKVMGSGAIMSPGSDPGMRTFEDDEMLELVNIAKLNNSHVAVHAHGEDAIYHCVTCGVRTIEHASFIGQRSIDLLKGRTDQGIVVTIAVLLSNVDAMAEDPTFAYVKDLTRRIGGRIQECLKSAYRQGVLIGWGTDIDFGQYRREPGIEFRYRKEALQFEDLDILKQATVNSAVLLGMEDRIGTIKEGKIADLIAVEGRPDADITCMYHPPKYVICNGKLVAGEE